MKKYILAITIILALFVGWRQLNRTNDSPVPPTTSTETVASAFKEQKSGVQVTGEGVVTKLLPDDNDGSRHQRFVLSLASGQTLLVSHNIDLAPRLTSLEQGDLVSFSGLYEWNARGGLVHLTHRDPSGQHPAGWLKHKGEVFH